jgi:hypothetical protein
VRPALGAVVAGALVVAPAAPGHGVATARGFVSTVAQVDPLVVGLQARVVSGGRLALHRRLA